MRLQAALSTDFFFDLDAALEAIRRDRLFNIMHLATAIKIDLIVRKATEYRHVEFARRQPVSLGSVPTWIVTREDLILSKLEWSKDSGSEMQRRDVRQLLSVDLDWAYLDLWAPTLGVVEALQALRP